MQGDTKVAVGTRRSRHWLIGAVAAIGLALGSVTGPVFAARGTNVLPTVSLSASPTTVVVGAFTTLTATASDSDGTVRSVTFLNGNTQIATVTQPPYTTNWMAANAGTYSLTAVAKDNSGASTTSAPVTITVGSGGGNVPPTVSLSSSSTSLTLGAAATLTATAADSDGSISKVEFYDGATLMSTDASSPYTATFSPTIAGTFTITARAYDNLGAQTTSTGVTITVGSSTNKPPMVSLSSSSTSLTVGGAVATITANASDRDGTIAKVEFYNGTTLIATDIVSPYTATFSPTAIGTFSITARAYDNLGAQTTSSAININVGAGTNKPPTVTLASSSTTLAVGGFAATLTATAADTDGTIAKVEFYNGTTLIATDTTSPYNATFTPTVAGNFSITAKAYDNLGLTTTSTAVVINVSSTNRLPTVSLATSTTTLPIGGVATLTATASDPDGTISKVEFYNGASLFRTATTAPYTAGFNGATAGTYTLTARAYDNLGAQTTSSAVTVTVSATATNTPPTVTLAASSTAFTLGFSSLLTATATDVDGTITKVEFYNGATLMATDTTSPYTSTFIPAAVGTYAMTAKAYDNLGGITTSAPVNIVVSPAPLLPRITLALSNTLFAYNSTTPPVVTLTSTAAATATGATVTRVSFFMNGSQAPRPLGPAVHDYGTVDRAQTYTFYAEVQDSLGQIVRTLDQQAEVQSAPPVATTDPDIWRLLNQATFGASQEEAAKVIAAGSTNTRISNWIDAQIAKPISGYPDAKYNRIQLTTTPDCTTQHAERHRLPRGLA